MKTKDDPALIEVWEMKKALQKAFKQSNFEDYVDYIKQESEEIRGKYNIRFRNKNLREPVTK